jgi:hypothetical protein
MFPHLFPGGFFGLVLASGTQVRGFKPANLGEKILSMPSFRGEVVVVAHVVDLRHVKDP